MQKKLLTIAVAAALAAPVAVMADVTVYGQAHYSYDWVDGARSFDGNKDVSEDATGVSRQTRIGFKGAEDLGGGLKGLWQIETLINNSPNAGDVNLRNTFVGLSGGFGTVLAGRHDTPYKLSTGKLDPFGDKIGDYNVVIGNYNGAVYADERVPQTIAYVSPNFSGFHGAIAYVSHYVNNATGDGNEQDRAVSAMVQYDNAGFFASAAYEWGTGNNAANVVGVAGFPGALGAFDEPEIQSMKFGLGYTFAGFSLGGIYENIDLDRGKGFKAADRDAYYVSAKYAFGNSAIGGFWGMADDIDGEKDSKDSGAYMYGIGYDYNLSKRTQLYAMYAGVNNERNAQYSVWTGGGMYDNKPGHNINGYSLGVIHKF
jgi:predicted porin